jgi:hypothetical protein
VNRYHVRPAEPTRAQRVRHAAATAAQAVALFLLGAAIVAAASVNP